MELTPALPTIFTTHWCGYCVRLKTQLNRAGIEFRRGRHREQRECRGVGVTGQFGKSNRAYRAVSRRLRADESERCRGQQPSCRSSLTSDPPYGLAKDNAGCELLASRYSASVQGRA